MTPDYPYGCKRRVFDSDWLPSMHNSKFDLINEEILAVDGKELILRGEEGGSMTERRIKADLIILANGFEATRWLHPLSVYGRGGISMQDVWDQRGGPQAYMGMAVDGFPNFVMITGPNTASGTHSLTATIESMVSYTLKIIKPVLRGEAMCVEAKEEAVLRWTQGI